MAPWPQQQPCCLWSSCASPCPMSDFWDREVVARQHIEWMGLLPVRLHINELIGGEERKWPIEWFESWLQGRKFCRALSVGCGAGALERQLIERGLCQQIDAFDGSITSLHIACSAARQAGLADRIRYFAADFNRCALPRHAYDIVFFHQSAHHVTALEELFSQLLTALKPNGLLYLDEYVGPSRFDWNDSLLAAQRAFYECLPRAMRAADRLPLPIQQDDPSEAVRSGDIESRLKIGFEIAPAIRWHAARRDSSKHQSRRDRRGVAAVFHRLRARAARCGNAVLLCDHRGAAEVWMAQAHRAMAIRVYRFSVAIPSSAMTFFMSAHTSFFATGFRRRYAGWYVGRTLIPL